MSNGLDRFDHMLIIELARNARLSNVDLGERVGLSSSAVARRIKALEDEGLITGYHAEFDLKRLGYGATVMLRVKLESQGAEAFEAFEKAAAACPSVVQCLLVSGADDYLVRILVKDVDDYERVMRTQISGLPRVAHVQSDFAIRSIVSRSLPEVSEPAAARVQRLTNAKVGRQPNGAR